MRDKDDLPLQLGTIGVYPQTTNIPYSHSPNNPGTKTERMSSPEVWEFQLDWQVPCLSGDHGGSRATPGDEKARSRDTLFPIHLHLQQNPGTKAGTPRVSTDLLNPERSYITAYY